MILLNYQAFLGPAAITCVVGLAGTERQNIESFFIIIQVQSNYSFKFF